MEINKWMELFAKAVAEKFPKPWTAQQRLMSVVRQVADASGALAVAEGLLPDNGKHGYDEFGHRLAAILVDLFVLAEKEGVDLDEELVEVLRWFDSKEQPPAQQGEHS